MTTSLEDYNFVFVGGSCGSFVKAIWAYYIHQNKLRFNKLTGDAHNAVNYKHFHDCNILDIKKNSPHKKIVLIMFDNDDLDLITKLQYFKFNKNWLENNLELAQNLYPQIADKLLDRPKWQDTWQEFLKEAYQDWLQRVDWENADFIIDFKTIYGKSNKNLNQLISGYLNTDPQIEVDTFINEYRLTNYKLYGK